MKRSIRILCVAAAFLLLFAACAQDHIAQVPETEPTAVPEITPEPITEAEVVSLETPTPEPTEEPTPEPTEEPTPEPTETPVPTIAPKEGDITTAFPDYDTGVDADYSYQSDNLRIAITVHHETLRDHNNRALSETYYVADIWVRNINSMQMEFANGEFKKGKEEGDALARRVNAVFAVNGSYNQGLILKEGKICQGLRKNKGWNSGAVCIIYRDGSMKTFYLQKESLNLEKEIRNGAWFGWQFGPILIRNYKEGPRSSKYYNTGFKARNVLGYYEPGHYVIVNCDNRTEQDAMGMNEYMLVNLMQSLGVKEAFNLDGGTSAVMVFMGKTINHPTLRNDDGARVEGRPLTDMLVFGECDENGAFTDLSALTASKNKN